MATRIARAASPSRWRDYRNLLAGLVVAHGYKVVPLEGWLDAGAPRQDPTFVLRHDVDQHPRSALRMLAIEQELGLTSTWYFRWRTADPHVIDAVRRGGGTVGFHYETLSRLTLRSPAEWRQPGEDRLGEARAILRAEIEEFSRRFGPVRSISAHGDTRLGGTVDNSILLRGQDPGEFGVELDASEAMRDRRLAYWLTDRPAAGGGWGNGLTPGTVLEQGLTPVLCLTHPNNWASGPSTLSDRVLSLVLPSGVGSAPRRPVRTRRDEPPRTRR